MNRLTSACGSAATVLLAAACLCTPAGASASTGGELLEFHFTVGTELTPDACASTTDIAVGYGDQVNFCYRIVNHGENTLRFHVLHDDAVGRLLTLEPVDVAPGAGWQYNRIAAATGTRTIAADWRTLAGEPGYVDEHNDPSVLFGDGFDGDDRVPFAFVDISQTGIELEIPSNSYWVPVQLPFSFDFYGIVSDRLALIEYGAVAWDTSSGEGNIHYLPGPLTDSLGPGLFPYWTDMFQSGGRFFQQVLGEAPNRRAVLQWDRLHYNLGDFPESGTVTFQLMLEEGSGRIHFSYLDAAFGAPAHDYGLWATVGLSSGAGFRLQYPRSEPTLDDHYSLRFTPLPVSRAAAHAEVRVDVGAPVIAVEPATLAATVAAGASTAANVTVGNTGTRDLHWSLGEAPSRMHFPVAPRIALPLARSRQSARDWHAIAAPAGTALAAFAWMDTAEESFVSLDAADPAGGMVVIDDHIGRFLMGGDFIDDDFSAFYALDWWSQQLVRVQTVDCDCVDQVVVIGPPGNPAGGPQPLEGRWVGMSWDASNARLYAVAYDEGFRRSTLYEIDLKLIRARALGRITGVPGNGFGHTMVQGLAVSPEGLMYGIEAFGDNLIAIDKVTGEAAIIGALGLDLPNEYRPQLALDFDDAGGDLYMAANLGIHTVDTISGASRLVGSTGDFPLDSLAIASSSPCVQPEDIAWLSLDQGAGAEAPGESTSLAVSLDASALAAGEYRANLCITSNDPLHGRVIVPIALTVQ